MYCSTCGAAVPPGSGVCGSCGAAVGRAPVPGPPAPRELVTEAVGVCPRCGYQGQGLPYFARGSHVAALALATFVTMGAMGLGGLAYYLARRDHRICPRCGKRWGRFGERALVVDPVGPRPRGGWEGEGRWRRLEVAAFVLAAMLATIGISFGEVQVLFPALLAAGAGVALHPMAERARDKRRAALLAALEQPVLQLAARERGVLTVTQVAAELGWPLRRAEKVLRSMDDGYRVSSEVTDDGLIVYEFLELLPRGDDRSPPGASG